MNEQSSMKTNSDTPDDLQIIEMLGKFSPIPSARFDNKMEKAPWMKTGSKERGRLFSPHTVARRLWLGSTVVILILAIIGLSFSPPVRAVARQIIYSFISEPSDQINIQTTVSLPEDLFHFSDSSNFLLSLKEVQGQAGFNVKELFQPPEGLNIVGSRFDSSYSAVTTLYQGKDFKLFLSQRPVGGGEDVFSIGSTAQVDLVNVGGQNGEFVKGGWKAISTQAISITVNPDNQTSITAVWDNDLPQFTLRWQEGEFIYEIRTIGEGSPSQSELIALANRLK
jgi:hypothetical protein